MRSLILCVLCLSTSLSLPPASAQEKKDEKKWTDVTGKLKLCSVPLKKGKDVLGYYVKPAGMVDPKKINNPRYFVTGADMEPVQAVTAGTELRIGVKSNEDGRGAQFLNMEGCIVLCPVDGKESERVEITEADQSVVCNKGMMVVIIPDYNKMVAPVQKKK